jgi:hypothetical protein
VHFKDVSRMGKGFVGTTVTCIPARLSKCFKEDRHLRA